MKKIDEIMDPVIGGAFVTIILLLASVGVGFFLLSVWSSILRSLGVWS